MKLDENERGNQTRLMKIKDMMLEEAIERNARTAPIPQADGLSLEDNTR